MILRNYQIRFINDKSPRILAGWARQSGKDVALRERLLRAKGTCLIIVANYSNKSMLLNALRPVEYRNNKSVIKLVKGGPDILILVEARVDFDYIKNEKYEAVIAYEATSISDEVLLNMLDLKHTKQTYFIGTPKHQPKGKRKRYDAFTILWRLSGELGISVNSVTMEDIINS